MNCVQQSIKNKHQDLVVQDFVNYIYTNPEPKEEDLQKYALYFGNNHNVLNNLLVTLDEIIEEYKF